MAVAVHTWLSTTGPRNARVAKISDFGLSVLVGFEEMRSQRLTTLTSMRNVSGHTLSTTGSTYVVDCQAVHHPVYHILLILLTTR